jgi:predicted NBD/HSP70 family sugar kinase
MEQYLGIDVGGTNVKMGIVDATDGRISNFYSHDTASWRSSGHFIERLGDAIALSRNRRTRPDLTRPYHITRNYSYS